MDQHEETTEAVGAAMDKHNSDHMKKGTKPKPSMMEESVESTIQHDQHGGGGKKMKKAVNKLKLTMVVGGNKKYACLLVFTYLRFRGGSKDGGHSEKNSS